MSVKIIAGPCSISATNAGELKDIISFNNNTRRPIYGVRVVGLKSRTELKNDALYMGIDFDVHMKMYNEILNGNFSVLNNANYPSVEIAKEILDLDKNITIATEIVDPVRNNPDSAARAGT